MKNDLIQASIGERRDEFCEIVRPLDLVIGLSC